MTPRRLIYVLNIFPKISETFIAGELAELRRRGIEVRILSLLPPRPEIQHQVIRRAGLDRLVEYDIARFIDVVREFQPDLLHAHFAKEATEKARELSQLTGVPFTFTAHGYDIYRKPPPDFRERAEAAQAVVTVSEANADYIHRTFGVLRSHIHLIPCGVDTEQFRPAKSAARGAPVILCVARLVEVKNLSLLLEACAVLRDRAVKFRCVLIGDGPLRGELLKQRAQLRLNGCVKLPGAAEQTVVQRWWQRAAIGVLTSRNEGMPVSLMEAAACGVPVVATSVGGIPEMIQHRVTGWLVPPGDPKAFASALERLLQNSKLRRRLGLAARRHAEKTFSVSRQVDSLLTLWSAILMRKPRADVTVSDPFGAARDAGLPTLARALDPRIARSEFKRRLPRLSANGKLKLKAIRVTRHKPGRRCVIEYDVKVRRPDVPEQRVTLIGKVRARRSGNEAFRVQEAIWEAGFDADSADGVSVPEPIGVISSFQMWFQRKVPGETAEKLLSGPDGVPLARRIAAAIHRLHRAGVPTEKTHGMDDELRILGECFGKVAALRPEWDWRLKRVQTACERLGASLRGRPVCGIHRDFYSAQVIVDGDRLWLVDFDLYCLGDPALDVGNFIGHITEQALREHGRPGALRNVERELEDRFVELSGESAREAVRVYSTLTLARHIYLSTRFPERKHLTERLLRLCEARLKIRS